MINKIINKLKDQTIAILGFGREGQSTYKFIRKNLPNKHITIIDQNDVSNNTLLSVDSNIDIIFGKSYLDNLQNYDLVIKTPGISLKDIDTKAINITSEIELLLEVDKENIIGVTGTKGKSTTSSLIYSIIKSNNLPVLFAGNIGIPVFDLLDEITPETLIVIEMSSHQLEYLNISPHIGVVLNLYEDHLDHAGSVAHYHEIKMKMFANQTSSDYMVYCSDNDTLNNLVAKNKFKSRKNTVSTKDPATIEKKGENVYYNNEVVFTTSLKRNLLGEHNFENIMVAYMVSKILKLDDTKTLEAISNFKPLEYRLEHFADINNVAYYVDTLATIPSATLEAINSIPNVNTLIFGGMDRGISYDGFAEALTKSNVEHFICMPTTGHVIGASLPKERTYYVETLKEASDLAKKITKPNTSCVLSPAAASYEHFKNYAEKGDKFKEYIQS
ncbi:MAG TPA: UDP-N-acetylmuramoyl-L-alanine--D-glutamate ligase [Firmicutes bacterium]|nr:UDP-N-acetylmuramoyl-L-alanine--D-glutamate ligase [Bacillota bacterium]